MLKIYKNIKYLFLILSLITLFNIKNAFSYQNPFSEDRNNVDYSYNIFSTDTWNISPYVFVGYSHSWVPYYNKNSAPYGNMLRNGHDGFVISSGVTINRNWSLGVSFQKLWRSSSIRNYSSVYPQIDKIKSNVSFLNLDLALRLPLRLLLLNNQLDLSVVTGLNIAISHLNNIYNAGTKWVPVELTSMPYKTSLGTNIGLSFAYRIISGFYVGIECKRVFILTKKSSLIRDSWLTNIMLGIKF